MHKRGYALASPGFFFFSTPRPGALHQAAALRPARKIGATTRSRRRWFPRGPRDAPLDDYRRNDGYDRSRIRPAVSRRPTFFPPSLIARELFLEPRTLWPTQRPTFLLPVISNGTEILLPAKFAYERNEFRRTEANPLSPATKRFATDSYRNLPIEILESCTFRAVRNTVFEFQRLPRC